MNAVLEPLLQSPKLPLYVEELTNLLASERAARQKFRETISDSEVDGTLRGVVISGFAVPVRAAFDEKLNAQVLAQICAVGGSGI